MPFESQAQRRFMYATNPKMAKRFEKKTKKKNLPEKVKKSPIEIAMRLLKLDYVFPHGLPNPDEDAKPHHDLIAEISQQPVQEYGNAELDYMFQILGHPSFENEALFQKVHQEVNEREMDDVYSERHPIFTDSSMFESHRDWQDMNKSEPMDLAWRLLKRQTELGEFHEDFPSSLGPVTEYHGTMNLPAVSEQGIKARSSRKRSKKYVPEQLRGQDITYTTPDQEKALAFAQERAQSLGLPSSQVGVVGVRAGGLPSPIQHQEPFGVLGGTMSNVRPSAIPRANIVPVLKMPIVDTEVPGLRIAHGFDEPVRELHEYNPNAGYGKKWKAKPGLIGATNFQTDEMIEMTPNEYFDRLAEVGMNTFSGQKRFPIPHEHTLLNQPQEIQDKFSDEHKTLESMRHRDMKFPPGEGPRTVDRIIEGIKEGKIMGAPEIDMAGDTPTGYQEGGHRMDALRLMGYGDTPIPVAITRQMEGDM